MPRMQLGKRYWPPFLRTSQTYSTKFESEVFLLDTSFVSEAVNPQARKHRAAHDVVNQNALFADQFYLCVITLSEMEFGLNLLSLQQPPAASERVAEVKSRIEQMVKMGEMLTVDHHVAREHARLRAAYAAVRMPNVIAK